MIHLSKNELILVGIVMLTMAVYFIIATPVMMDDGGHYEGFTESLAHGRLDFKSFYGFQGLSFFAVPVYWLTGSHISIIITSAIFSLLSIPLAYLIGRDYHPAPNSSADHHKGAGLVRDFASKKLRGNSTAGIYFMILILLTPYPYTTMMRGFQEAALLFFILLIIYGSIHKRNWIPTIWAIGGIVKPFALVLLPLFVSMSDLNPRKLVFGKIVWILVALALGGLYLGASYYQTGHLVNNAAIGSYEDNFNTGNPPPLSSSFVVGVKGFIRVGANLLVHARKILISPLVVILGAVSLLFNKGLRLRQEFIFAIVLNFILVGSLTFSFSKYLLPMAILLALAAMPYLQKYRWFMALVFIDSLFVFLPIWNYFGNHFWNSVYIYFTPIYLSVAIYCYAIRSNNFNPNS